MTCIVNRKHLEDMIAHSREGLPNEACGIIAGRDGQALKLYCTANTEASPARYVIDAREQLHIMREIEDSGWDLLGIFHSHTHSPAYPSQTDVQLAYYNDALYFIVSLMNEEPIVRAFRIVDAMITEEAIVVQDE